VFTGGSTACAGAWRSWGPVLSDGSRGSAHHDHTSGAADELLERARDREHRDGEHPLDGARHARVGEQAPKQHGAVRISVVTFIVASAGLGEQVVTQTLLGAEPELGVVLV
jgi:hypothetical protein